MNTEFIVHPQEAVDYRMTGFNCMKKEKYFWTVLFADNI